MRVAEVADVVDERAHVRPPGEDGRRLVEHRARGVRLAEREVAATELDRDLEGEPRDRIAQHGRSRWARVIAARASGIAAPVQRDPGDRHVHEGRQRVPAEAPRIDEGARLLHAARGLQPIAALACRGTPARPAGRRRRPCHRTSGRGGPSRAGPPWRRRSTPAALRDAPHAEALGPPPAVRRQLREGEVRVLTGSLDAVGHRERPRRRDPRIDGRAAVRERDARRPSFGKREVVLGLGASGRPWPATTRGRPRGPETAGAGRRRTSRATR